MYITSANKIQHQMLEHWHQIYNYSTILLIHSVKYKETQDLVLKQSVKYTKMSKYLWIMGNIVNRNFYKFMDFCKN